MVTEDLFCTQTGSLLPGSPDTQISGSSAYAPVNGFGVPLVAQAARASDQIKPRAFPAARRTSESSAAGGKCGGAAVPLGSTLLPCPPTPSPIWAPPFGRSLKA